MRFLFGAGISLVAGLAGMAFGPKIGGVLLGFPAILPASLTLIQKKEGKQEASVDSIGAILGAIAMIVFAVVVSVSVVSLGVASSLLIALLVWLAVAVRSEEHTSELQSRFDLVCRLLLEKKNRKRLACPST